MWKVAGPVSSTTFQTFCWDGVTARSRLTVLMFQGWLTFSGSRVSMQFSVPRDQRAYEQPRVQSDWICAKVCVENYGSAERKILILCNLLSAVFRTSAEEMLVSSATLHGLNMILPKSTMRPMKLAHTRQTVSFVTFVTFCIVYNSSLSSCPPEWTGCPHD